MLGSSDVYVQFLQTYEGVEGDSASLAVATAIISALKMVPVKQEWAMTGSLSVRGEVLPVGGVSAKIEAAIDAGITHAIVPKSNLNDIVVDAKRLKRIEIVPVESIIAGARTRHRLEGADERSRSDPQDDEEPIALYEP
jgi:ATP-dependent Lon protease